MARNRKFYTSYFTANSPDERHELRNKAVDLYNEGKEESSIYYQVNSLNSILQDRYYRMPKAKKTGSKSKLSFGTTFLEMEFEDNSPKDCEFMDFITAELEKHSEISCKRNSGECKDDTEVCRTFDVDPTIGFKEIVDMCKEFPTEWTILQVWKSPRPQMTYLDFQHIHQCDADVYLTLLRHARSADYPEPICLRFSAASQVELFNTFSKLSVDCKKYMDAGKKDVLTREQKAKYWENLKNLDDTIRQAVDQFKEYIFPWTFLFKGQPRSNAMSVFKTKDIFKQADKFCDTFKLSRKERILLSLACLHVLELVDTEIEAICDELTKEEDSQASAVQLMLKIREYMILNASPIGLIDKKETYTPKCYPCILIVDEQLDHFYWEEINASQELSRVNSLYFLWKLFTANKSKIKKGYLCVDVQSGGCVLNPGSNLHKTEMRLRSFFEYWKPSWLLKCHEIPTEAELIEDFFKRDCFVYAGHGSGLQLINGKKISKQIINAIVFLFGCDSTRMHSNGLYSELIGPHFYYHAAMCPCLVGSILPALDSRMDNVAVELISRWITPDIEDRSWQQIDTNSWLKKGIIQKTEKYIIKGEKCIGSLCGVLTRIHERGYDKFFYNTVPYVCRGLPVWNCNVQSLPE